MYKLKNFIFLFIIFITPILFFLSSKQTISEFENRNLSTFPNISKTSVLNTTFFNEFEEYISDHFPARNTFLKLNTNLDFILNKTIVNDIVIVNDTLLPYFSGSIDTYSRDDFDKMNQTLTTFNDFCINNNIDFIYVGIPEQSSAFKSQYPSFLNDSMYINDDLQADFYDMLAESNINFIDMSIVFADNPYKFYSTTDHHYNFFGAYATYIEICDFVNENLFYMQKYDDIVIKDTRIDFLGSRNRKLLGLFKSSDLLFDYNLISDIKFVRYDNGILVEPTLFDVENNSYNYYMGGDKAETILTTNRPELRNLLIIGDSFTNPLETLIYTGFNETRSIDLRYNSDINLHDYILDFSPDLIIYVRDDISFINNDGNGNLNIK